MGHRTTLNVNVKINDFINYSKAGMPYVKADFDSGLEADEEDVLDEFIKTFLEADSELLKRVQEIVANHVTTY